MRRVVSIALLPLLLSLSSACSDGEPSAEYWVEGSDPVILRGVAPEGVPDVLELRGLLRYDAASGCLTVESAVSDNEESVSQVLIWHMETEPVREGDRVGVVVQSREGEEVTLWDGDVLAGALGPADLTGAGIEFPCGDLNATSVYSVSAMAQAELLERYEQASGQ